MLRRFGLESGYIYLKFTSLHMKELVLTDRPLRQCQSMKGMNEQSDLIVLTLELSEQKYMCATGRQDVRKLLPQQPHKKILFLIMPLSLGPKKEN